MSGTEINKVTNMERKKVSDLTGFRLPNDQERQQVRNYMLCKNKRIIKNSETTCDMFLIFGLIMGLVTSRILLTCVFLLLALVVNEGQKEIKKRASLWSAGTFVVLDGIALSVKGDSDNPEMVNVQFQSIYGEILEDTCRVKMENVTEGSHILLAYIQRKNEESIFEAFTPYMMEEETKE